MINKHDFKTDRLKINEISWSDLTDIHELYSLKEINKFNTNEIPSNINETKKDLELFINDQKLKKRKNFCWRIEQINSNVFIGCIGMNVFADRFKLGKIFFYLRPEFWGQGFATESTKEIIKFGFDKLGLHRIEAGADTNNLKSLHVLEKCNMKNEGIRRKLLPINGDWKDCFQYSLLESDIRNF